MASESPKNLSSTDEDDVSCDEDKVDGRRRRFCIERKQEEKHQKQNPSFAQRQAIPIKPNSSRIRKLPKLNHASNRNMMRHQIGKISGIAKRKLTNNTPPNHRVIPTTTSSKPEVAKNLPKSPVIFINPRLVKRFLEKSLKLASSKDEKDSALNDAPKKSLPENPDSVSGSSKRNSFIPSDSVPTSSSSISMIEDIDFKTKPKEALKAASTMAIIRIVTECIEDAHKRDEELNKTLVSQLIDKLVYVEKVGPSTTEIYSPNQTHTSRHDESVEISKKEDGQPIPVIGGSVSRHFNKANTS